ncbi:MAG: hypothetical protein M3467_11910 [Actinomycetota bacterium]|nr:hypothetical protein [Actinomycetota bacterium]
MTSIEANANPRDVVPPDPGAISGLITGVTFVAAILGAIRLAKGPIPRPGSPAAAVRTYYHDSALAARFSVAGQVISILSLARFTASVARLAGRSGPAPRKLQAVALVSGAASVVSLATSATTHASLSLPRERGDERVLKLARRVFVAGGPVHGVAYGVFTGALAVVGHRNGLLGRAATTTGMVSAAAGVLSPLYFRWENAGWLIPIGRFSGYAVGGIAGTHLARASKRL